MNYIPLTSENSLILSHVLHHLNYQLQNVLIVYLTQSLKDFERSRSRTSFSCLKNNTSFFVPQHIWFTNICVKYLYLF